LVRAYQVRGHHVAELDPLGILDADLADVHPPELELSRYGFTERDLDKQIALGPGILPHFATEDRKSMSLRDIIKTLKRIYCKFLNHAIERFLNLVKAVLLVFNMFTFLTRNNAIGSEKESRPLNPGTTH
jgi:hypothetical protein